LFIYLSINSPLNPAAVATQRGDLRFDTINIAKADYQCKQKSKGKKKKKSER